MQHFQGEEMDEKDKLVKAAKTAEILVSDLREIIKHTDNLPLEELMIDALEQAERLRRRLKRFSAED